MAKFAYVYIHLFIYTYLCFFLHMSTHIQRIYLNLTFLKLNLETHKHLGWNFLREQIADLRSS